MQSFSPSEEEIAVYESLPIAKIMEHFIASFHAAGFAGEASLFEERDPEEAADNATQLLLTLYSVTLIEEMPSYVNIPLFRRIFIDKYKQILSPSSQSPS